MKSTLLGLGPLLAGAIAYFACVERPPQVVLAPEHHPHSEAGVTVRQVAAERFQSRIIVELEGRDRVIVISSGPSEPLYTVRTKAEGINLLQNMPLSRLRVTNPRLHDLIESAIATPDTQPILWGGL